MRSVMSRCLVSMLVIVNVMQLVGYLNKQDVVEDNLRVRSLEVVNEDGKVVGRFASDPAEDTAILTLLCRASQIVEQGEVPADQWINGIQMGFVLGYPEITVRDTFGKPRVRIDVIGSPGTARVAVFDRLEQLRAELRGSLHETALTVYDRNGQELLAK